ncbi:heterokaryon incompatibility protein-domain-containing protein [Xylaria sp. FL0064]|nr:heterokaryon incompatibility protein-domain-containing protein [Xylaria sp. FL0064]
METYTYAPLNPNEPTFRLIRLFPGAGQQLQCELIHASLAPGEMMDYEAVSYTWGSVTHGIFFIEIHGEKIGKLSIDYNLFRLFLSLRDPVVDRILWIDAICINQDEDDATERNHQVQQMARIYRGAQRVLVWLGPPTDEMILAMILLRRIQKLCRDTKREVEDIQESDWRDLQYNDSKYHNNPTRLGLEQIFSHPWFYRMWILQEVGNAQTALIHCGKHAVSSSVFCQAPSILNLRLDSHRQAVLNLMPGSQVRLKEGSSHRDLRTLLHHFGEAQTTRQHDHIYALLGLCLEEDNRLRVSYEKSISTVISEAISLFLRYEVSGALYSSILEFRGHLNHLDENVLERLVAYGYTNSLRCAFERPGANTTVTETVMLAGARNPQKGREVFDIFARNTVQLHVTEAVLLAAAENDGQGKEILDIILPQAAKTAITERVIQRAVQNETQGKGIISIVLPRVEKSAITEEVILAAAGNRTQSKEILDIILSHTGKSAITESAAVRAAQTCSGGGPILDGFLSRADIPITKRLVMAATENSMAYGGGDEDLLDTILQRAQDLPLSEKVLLAVIHYCGRDGRCLDVALQRADESAITADVLAAATFKYGEEALDIMYQPRCNALAMRCVMLVIQLVVSLIFAVTRIFPHIQNWGVTRLSTILFLSTLGPWRTLVRVVPTRNDSSHRQNQTHYYSKRPPNSQEK